MTTLNPQQMQAVQHDTGALLVLAGAGSGKTRIVTQRILSLIESGVLPQQIVAITFTNKAAKEMQERVKDMGYSSVLVRTFHSLGAYILRESIHHLGYDAAFTIYDEDDKQKLISQIAKKLKVDLKQCSTKQASQCISSLKNSFHEESHLKQLPLEERSLVDEWVSLIWPQYQQTLRDNNAVDFDDLIVLPVKLFNSFSSVKDIYVERWPYLLIDEYQDTNPTQCFLARLLAGNYHNILAVGDPDQSIYSWRGADIQNIMNFEQDFPEAKVVYLEQNYRSTETILQASNALIQNNTTRYDKKLWRYESNYLD